ncbi:MAG: hypothetical protein JNN15_03180 [Blastocatellia bacterium]|jgi:hypothetical protein|nr:hypothetical protein [Blastocatellia bacterium]
MSKQQLVVKKEALPDRCEICHQSDCFDPQTGHCSRCSLLPVEKIDAADKRQQRPQIRLFHVAGNRPTTSSKLVLSLVASIGSALLMFMGLFLLVFVKLLAAMLLILSLGGSLVGFLLANAELSSIARGQSDQTGEGLATLTRTVSIVVITVLHLIYFLLVFQT